MNTLTLLSLFVLNHISSNRFLVESSPFLRIVKSTMFHLKLMGRQKIFTMYLLTVHIHLILVVYKCTCNSKLSHRFLKIIIHLGELSKESWLFCIKLLVNLCFTSGENACSWNCSLTTQIRIGRTVFTLGENYSRSIQAAMGIV